MIKGLFPAWGFAPTVRHWDSWRLPGPPQRSHGYLPSVPVHGLALGTFRPNSLRNPVSVLLSAAGSPRGLSRRMSQNFATRARASSFRCPQLQLPPERWLRLQNRIGGARGEHQCSLRAVRMRLIAREGAVQRPDSEAATLGARSTRVVICSLDTNALVVFDADQASIVHCTHHTTLAIDSKHTNAGLWHPMTIPEHSLLTGRSPDRPSPPLPLGAPLRRPSPSPSPRSSLGLGRGQRLHRPRAAPARASPTRSGARGRTRAA